MITLYLVRHGENKANITKELSYKIIDYDLTDKGRLQAVQTAKYFEDIKIDKIVSSPLKRAVQTADIIATAKGIHTQIKENFRELNVGDLEKIGPNDDTWKTYFSVTSAWYQGDLKVSFPNGENCINVLERFYSGVLDVIGNDINSNIVIVGHGGIFTVSVLEFCKIQDREKFVKIQNENCSISKIEVFLEKKELTFKLLSWAESNHIEGSAAIFIKWLPEINN